MSTRDVFRTLVNNDARLGFHFKYFKKTGWNYFGIFVILLVIGLYLFTPVAEVLIIILSLITGIFNPFLLMAIPYLLTQQVINHEWQNRTAGWWLSLPYSRTFLMASKSTVGFFRFLKIILIFVPVIVLLTVITAYLQPDASNARLLHDFPQRVLYNAAIGIMLSPLSISLSSLMTVLDKSRIKKVLRFLPAAIFLPIILLSNANFFPSIFGTLLLNFLFHPTWSSLFVVFGVSLGLGALLFLLAVYVLEHKIDV